MVTSSRNFTDNSVRGSYLGRLSRSVSEVIHSGLTLIVNLKPGAIGI